MPLDLELLGVKRIDDNYYAKVRIVNTDFTRTDSDYLVMQPKVYEVSATQTVASAKADFKSLVQADWDVYNGYYDGVNTLRAAAASILDDIEQGV